MNITEVKIYPMESGNLQAMANITIDNCFVVSGLRVMGGAKGLFVSMPSRKTKEGDYKDICFPVTKECREQIQKAVLGKFVGNTVDEYPQGLYIPPENGIYEVTPEADLPF